MGVEYNVLGEYAGSHFELASASTTRSKWILWSAGSSGAHSTYPEDGRLHYTEPNPDGTVLRTFSDRRGAPLSDVTFEPFRTIPVPPGAPPADAKRKKPGSTTFLIPGASAGGTLYGFLVGQEQLDQLEAYVRANVPSAVTHRCSSQGDQRLVWVWERTS